GLVLDVRDRDGDTALTLLRGLVDLVERREGVQVGVLVVQDLGDRRGQGGLAVVDVTDRADVDVRLGPLELRLSHCGLLLLLSLDSLIVLDSRGSGQMAPGCQVVPPTGEPDIQWASLAADLPDDLVGDARG